MLQDILHRVWPRAYPTTRPAEDLGAEFSAIRDHVLNRINAADVGTDPFYHSFIESIFPGEFYNALRAHMLAFKRSDKIQPRTQDNPAFVNRRYNLVDSGDLVIRQFRAIFEDPAIKSALFSKYYLNPNEDLLQKMRIHEEFEYVFCEPDRFQRIHVDIPPKYLSFVFYIPEGEVSAEAEMQNATILYDKTLTPQYAARFRANSVCIFVPHFYSYHGFSSTTERDVLVMFYVHADEIAAWRHRGAEQPPYNDFLDAIEAKLQRHPLIEYGTDPERLAGERAACRINAPQGRVLVD